METRPQLPDWHAPRADTVTPDRATVALWLDAYVRAWKTYDPAAIADLWTEDAIWVQPFGIRARGRDAIATEWLNEQHLDEPDGYDAHYEPIAVDGDVVVTHGRTRFFDPATGQTQTEYDNIWVLRFGSDGRCAEFHEWYAGRPDGETMRFAAAGRHTIDTEPPRSTKETA